MQPSSALTLSRSAAINGIRYLSGIATSEPTNPNVKTKIPGPQSEKLKAEMAKVHVNFLKLLTASFNPFFSKILQ